MKKNINIKILSLLFLFAPFVQSTYSQWSSQTSGTSQDLVSVKFVNQQTGWAAGGSGTILRTTNGGLNWTSQTSPDSYTLVSIHFINETTGWISGVFGSLIKTTNAGTNWTSLTTGISGALRVYFANQNTGWVVGASGTILKSTNGGTNWAAQTTGTSSFLLNVQFSDENTGWACGQSGVMLKTTNGGTNWNAQSTGSTQNLYGLHFVNSSTGWTVGGNGNIYYTTNGGTNWSAQSAGSTDEFNSAYFANSNTGWISGSNGKIYVTSNGGTNWHPQTSSTTETLYSIFFTDVQKGWVVGTNGVIRATSNSGGLGLLWTAQDPGASASYNAICAVSSTVGWVAGSNGTVRRTVNGGNSWENVSGSPIGTSGLNVIFAFDQNTCLTADGNKIFRTSNGGVNWTQVHTQVSGFINDISFKDANTGFVNGDPSGGRWTLWKTTNGGINWDSTGLYLQQVGSETGKSKSMCVSGNNIWFGTDNFRIYYSTNFGSSWLYSITPCRNTRCVSFNGSTGFFGGDSLLMKSTNGGINWTGNYLPASSVGISTVSNAGGKWWVTKGDTIYVSTDGGNSFQFQYKSGASYYDMSFVVTGSSLRGWGVKGTGGIDTYFEMITSNGNPSLNIPAGFLLSQNYPNPFNPITKIRFNLPKQSSAKLTVYDINGREVRTIVNENLNAGNYEVEFDGANLSSGTYFYVLDAGEYRDVKKMVLIK